MAKRAILTKPFYIARRLSRRLWVRMALIALLALVAAGSSTWLELLLPESLANYVKQDAVERVLEIMASSMLTVTTFSLSVMVAARQWASSQSTPRAQKLMREDTVTQNALATFLGAFVFALFSYILLTTGAYSGGSVVVILGFTLIVVALVVLAILRWIHHLTSLGGVDQTSQRVEEAASEALDLHRANPCLGARPLSDTVPRDGMVPLASPQTGYVRHIDTGQLQDCAEASDTHVLVLAPPGTFIARGEALALAGHDADVSALTSAFTLSPGRTFEQDPVFGLEVLSEIAQRALSPGTNDPATAVDVVQRLTRLLLAADASGRPADPEFDRVFMAPLGRDEMLQAAFAAIAREAGGAAEVHEALQTAFRRLSQSGQDDLARAARAQSDRALAFAEAAIEWPGDLDRVRRAAPGQSYSAAS